MSKFHVGDRVAVYGPAWSPGHEGRMVSHKAEVVAVIDACTLHIRPADGKLYFVHPKQCRRLKKRERRRVWVGQIRVITPKQDLRFMEARFTEPSDYEGTADGKPWIEFIEVRKKESP